MGGSMLPTLSPRWRHLLTKTTSITSMLLVYDCTAWRLPVSEREARILTVRDCVRALGTGVSLGPESFCL
jgi:hypothetical protein